MPAAAPLAVQASLELLQAQPSMVQQQLWMEQKQLEAAGVHRILYL
jgi:hypothetical protein